MNQQKQDINKFFEALEEEKQTSQKQLAENPEKENNRLKWLEFKHRIEADWHPIMSEYLTVLGKLWFGYEKRLTGPEFRKKMVAFPSYAITLNVYGPMAVFAVQKNDWEEREAPYSETEGKTIYKLELFQRGYRCSVVMTDGGHYELQDDHHATLAQFNKDVPIDQEKLVEVFKTVYVDGPRVIFNKWKDPIWVGDDK